MLHPGSPYKHCARLHREPHLSDEETEDRQVVVTMLLEGQSQSLRLIPVHSGARDLSAQDRTRVRRIQIHFWGPGPPFWDIQGVPASEALSWNDHSGHGAQGLLG